MISGEDIRNIFLQLDRSGSFDAALYKGLRVACDAIKGCAGGLRVGTEVSPHTGWWMLHDPHCLLGFTDPCSHERGRRQEANRHGKFDATGDDFRRVNVPLGCADFAVGSLSLMIPKDADAGHVEALIEPLGTVLATLLSASVAALTGHSGLLSYSAFRARIDADLAQAKRSRSELSVLHLRWQTDGECSEGYTPGRWSKAQEIGEVLVSQLRRSDTVGLIAPDHLAALLPATGRVGAVIAQRRIEQLLLTLQESTEPKMAVEFTMRLFPTNESDGAQLLCCGALKPQFAEQNAC